MEKSELYCDNSQNTLMELVGNYVLCTHPHPNLKKQLMELHEIYHHTNAPDAQVLPPLPHQCRKRILP